MNYQKMGMQSNLRTTVASTQNSVHFRQVVVSFDLTEVRLNGKLKRDFKCKEAIQIIRDTFLVHFRKISFKHYFNIIKKFGKNVT
jgi:hypothetical protein